LPWAKVSIEDGWDWNIGKIDESRQGNQVIMDLKGDAVACNGMAETEKEWMTPDDYPIRHERFWTQVGRDDKNAMSCATADALKSLQF
jgi:hypothetical protein